MVVTSLSHVLHLNRGSRPSHKRIGAALLRLIRLNRGSSGRRQQEGSLLNYTSEELSRAQTSDKAIGKILSWKTNGRRPHGTNVTSSSPEVRHYWNYWNSLEIHQGILFKRSYTQSSGSHLQLLVPQKFRRQLVDNMHGSVFGGHLGAKKTLRNSSKDITGST